jgi:hypothetical protein
MKAIRTSQRQNDKGENVSCIGCKYIRENSMPISSGEYICIKIPGVPKMNLMQVYNGCIEREGEYGYESRDKEGEDEISNR